MRKITGNEPTHPVNFKLEGLNEEWANGLTIRQYFAAMAMQGGRACKPSTTSNAIAKAAVEDADALIAALNGKVK